MSRGYTPNRTDAPRYSICITHRNNKLSLRPSLESLIRQIDDQFEVIVVDSSSSDGSLELLQEYSRKGLIQLVSEKCTRGRGRQLAFERSRGQYTLTNFDMDDTFLPVIRNLIEIYHQRFEGMMLRIISPKRIGRWEGFFANTIAPADLIRRLGGWANVQFGEDIDLWCRAAAGGKYAWIKFDLIESALDHVEKYSFWRRLVTKWRINRDFRKLGLTINAGTATTKVLKALSSVCYRAPSDEFRRNFSSVNSSYYHLSERYRVDPGVSTKTL